MMFKCVGSGDDMQVVMVIRASGEVVMVVVKVKRSDDDDSEWHQ